MSSQLQRLCSSFARGMGDARPEADGLVWSVLIDDRQDGYRFKVADLPRQWKAEDYVSEESIHAADRDDTLDELTTALASGLVKLCRATGEKK